MKLKSARVKFFQSHLNTLLNFHPGVNAIVGGSSKGKSALMRSMIWLITNKPDGTEYISWFSKKKSVTSVLMEFDDGISVEKRRRETEPVVNEYIVKDDHFRALKGKVPDEVKKALLLTDLNVQQQHQPYFLLNDTGGRVAEQFNKIANLQIIDDTLNNVNTAITQESHTEKVLKKQIKKHEDEVEFYKWTIQAKREIKAVTKQQKELDVLKNEKDQLEAKISLFCKAEAASELYKWTIQAKREIKKVERLQKDFYVLQLEETQLSDKISLFCEVKKMTDKISWLPTAQKGISSIQSFVTKFLQKQDLSQNLSSSIESLLTLQQLNDSSINFEDVQKDITQIESDKTKLDSLYGKYQKTQKAFSSASVSIKEYSDCKQEIKPIEEELKSYFQDNACPLCGTKNVKLRLK